MFYRESTRINYHLEKSMWVQFLNWKKQNYLNVSLIWVAFYLCAGLMRVEVSYGLSFEFCFVFNNKLTFNWFSKMNWHWKRLFWVQCQILLKNENGFYWNISENIEKSVPLHSMRRIRIATVNKNTQTSVLITEIGFFSENLTFQTELLSLMWIYSLEPKQ